MKKMKEMFEAMMNDPDLKNNPAYKDCEKFGDVLDELTNKIVAPCIDYANNHGDDDAGWAHTIMISMARATCKMLYAFQHTAAKEGVDIYDFYHDELLPLCKEVAYRESEEMVKYAERMQREAEEDKKVIMDDTKKDLILAMADPDVSVEEIIRKFFKKDLDDEQRQMVADHIAKMRVEHADRLKRIHEHTDEDGNYKA